MSSGSSMEIGAFSWKYFQQSVFAFAHALIPR